MNAKRILNGRELLPRSIEFSFPTLTCAAPETSTLQQNGGVEAIVPIGYCQADRKYIFLGARRGGRRYLSEDLEVLARMAACVGDAGIHGPQRTRIGQLRCKVLV